MRTFTYEVTFTIQVRANTSDQADEIASFTSLVPRQEVAEDDEGFEYRQLAD